ncbi:MAG: DUF2384 domain-containing protein [Pseudomonadota bacterium]
MSPAPEQHADRCLASSEPLLADPDVRARCTPSAVAAICRLAAHWGLSAGDIRMLLGDVSERTWFRMKSGLWSGSLSQDCMTRVSILLGLYEGLETLFDKQLAREWPTLANKGPLFDGRTPIEVMIAGGVPAMLDLRDHVDALRGGL